MFHQNAFVFASSLIIVNESYIIKNRDNIVRQVKYNEMKLFDHYNNYNAKQ